MMTAAPRNARHRPVSAAALAWLCAALPALAAAQSFEEPQRPATTDILPDFALRSTEYQVDEDVRSENGFYRFAIDSDFGRYEVASLAMLEIRLDEIRTLARTVPELNKQLTDRDAALRGKRGIGSDSVVDIITNPFGSASQLAGNLADNLEATLEGTPAAAPRELAAGTADFTEPGPHKRSAAAQLNVDVFSTNPYLQRVLDTIAGMRSAGKLRNPVAPAGLRPLVPTFGSGVFDAELKAIIKNNAVAELNEKLEATLAEMGVEKALRLQFLKDRAFSPTRRLYLVSYLELLATTAQREELVRASLAARTEADALAWVNAARMLAYYHLRVAPVARILEQEGVIAAVDRGGRLLAALPLDYLAWTADTDAIAQRLTAMAGADGTGGTGGIDILLSGTPSERAEAQLAGAGITVRPRFSLR